MSQTAQLDDLDVDVTGPPGPPDAATTGDGPAATAQLVRVAGGLVLSMATWFAASAAAPALRREWQLDGVGSTLLASAVQLGFVGGALGSAAVNLPDRLHPPRLAAAGSLGAAVSTAALAVVAGDALTAGLLRALTGLSLALVYPVALKLAVSWFVERRGLAVGVLVGALTLGSALPHLVGDLSGGAWRTSLLVSSGLAAVATLLFGRATVGPYAVAATTLRPGAVLALLRQPRPRLVTLGYLGHMWELYAMWVWAPAFTAASLRASGHQVSTASVHLLVFVALGACGVAGCLAGGWLGDRLGHARTAAGAMVTSGTCAVLAALTFGGPPWLVAAVLMVWGASVIADSAMFAACLGASVDRDLVGSALTLQTALGFLLTIVTIHAVPVVVDLTSWPAAVVLLAAGPLLGAVAMTRTTR